MTYQATPLDQAGFRRSPWKNGGGVSIAIAEAYRDGAGPGHWDDLIWGISRTSIITPAPFSDLSGIERMQVVVAGRGLVLEAPGGEIDVREPFCPVRFQGDTPIVSRLEAGPVDVVNLMGNRSRTQIDLRILTPTVDCVLAPGVHVLYAASEPCEFASAWHVHRIEQGGALRIDTAEAQNIAGSLGRTIVASVYPR